MKSYLSPSEWAEGVEFTGILAIDVRSFLTHYDRGKTYSHTLDVEREARSLAKRFGLDAKLAAQAALLHDISAVVPVDERAHVAKAWGLDVLPEEEAFPLIVHQKLSAVFATEVFGIGSESVLSAIACHTTLRANPTQLDTLVFVADKIQWDRTNPPAYLDSVVSALDQSLEEAAYQYLEYMWIHRSQLVVVHPWLVEAYNKLGQNRSG